MVFQGEDFVLTKDVLKPKSKEFVSTESEWSAKNRIFIGKSQGAAAIDVASETIIYTVPQNRVVFITAGWITFDAFQGTLAHTSDLYWGTSTTGLNNIMLKVSRNAIGSQGDVAISFPMPIKVPAGEDIKVRVLGGGADAGILAWEEDRILI